ncbi:hypothetical protein GCM10023091_04630 [Ravibacter arvi]|uniref:WD40 repeat protein n=1 Tax=Ravibacter arvi TaxID=2051041 RepID=A0ABP8LMC3_9BACT
MNLYSGRLKRSLLLLFVLALAVPKAHAQLYPSKEKFGKNRIQYRNFKWRIFQTSNYEVYFYQNGDNLARLTAQFAETEFDRVTDMLGYTPYNKIKIFLYNSPEELEQSNIGIATFDELNETDIDLAQSRLEVAFTGDQISFRKELVNKIAQLFVYDMLYGGNLKDALQSSILLSLPDWFMTGIARYVADGWSPELNNYMHDAIQNRNIRRPSLLEGEDAALIGQSIWNYIAEEYGKDNISNILNLTRIIRTEQTSITSTLGVPSFGKFLSNWRAFYGDVINSAQGSYQTAKPSWTYKIGGLEKTKPGTHVDLSLDNKILAVSEPNKRNYKVTTYNLETGRKMVIRQGNILSNHISKGGSIPQVGWTKDNNLVILVPGHNRHQLFLYEKLDTKKPKIARKTSLRNLDHIVDMDVSKDGTTLAVSADKGGQNDLYLININRGSTVPLTNDIYDDLSPRFVGNSNRKLIFASNRPSDSLRVRGNFKTIRNSLGLFEHSGVPRSASAPKLLDSLGTYNLPVYSTENDLYFLSDMKGVNNLFRYNYNSKTVSQNTNYIQGLKEPVVRTAGNGGLAYLQLEKGEVKVAYLNHYSPGSIAETPAFRKGIHGVTSFSRSSNAETGESTIAKNDTVQKAALEEPVKKLELRAGEVDTENYVFDEDVIQTIGGRSVSRIGSGRGTSAIAPRSRVRENININGPFNYKGLFIANDSKSEWAADPIRGFGYRQSISMNDLLENNVLKAGGFLGMDGRSFFKTYDLFLEYNLNKYRVDFGLRYDRTNFYQSEALAGPQKYRYNQVLLTAAYPFTRTARFSFSPAYTSTYLIRTNVSTRDKSSHYVGFKSELVFDNSIVNGLNMTEGTKMKIRYENHMGLSRISDSFYRVSIDLRRYQKIHRDLILAIRVAGSHSGGKSPKKSSMGGMENWIGPRHSNNETAYNPFFFGEAIDNRDVFFTEFATNMRGFGFNRLSGTTYMMSNVELRIPLVKYLYRGPITSNFLRNLQFAGFTDIGTAWTGKGPFSQENSLNTEIIGGNGLPFTASVVNFRNPYIWGYGVGVRTTLFGIYGKFDYAWGVDNSIVKKPIPYLTLGYDF